MPTYETNENIFLFTPNVIGYIRIVLATISLYYMPLHPRRCSALYAISCLLDAADGLAARYFDQSSRFGAVLDMLTDRCTTTCLLVFLAIANPAYAVVFQGLICLDFASHYMHMYATLALEKGGSHKDVTSNWILEIYYKKWVLFTLCAMNELFFIGLYLLCFSSPGISIPLLPVQSIHAKPVEHILGSHSPFSAAAMEIARANKINDTVPWYLTIVSLPFMAVKQFINVVQMVNASQRLAQEDRKQRMKLREERAR